MISIGVSSLGTILWTYCMRSLQATHPKSLLHEHSSLHNQERLSSDNSCCRYRNRCLFHTDGYMALDPLNDGTVQRSKMFLAAHRFPWHPAWKWEARRQREQYNLITIFVRRKKRKKKLFPNTLSPLLLNNNVEVTI